MAEKTKLEELGREIVGASVTAEFLGMRLVVDLLDQAFDEVVRRAMVEQDLARARAADLEAGRLEDREGGS